MKIHTYNKRRKNKIFIKLVNEKNTKSCQKYEFKT